MALGVLFLWIWTCFHITKYLLCSVIQVYVGQYTHFCAHMIGKYLVPNSREGISTENCIWGKHGLVWGLFSCAQQYAVVEKLKCIMEEIEASITTFKRKHSEEYGASHQAVIHYRLLSIGLNYSFKKKKHFHKKSPHLIKSWNLGQLLHSASNLKRLQVSWQDSSAN